MEILARTIMFCNPYKTLLVKPVAHSWNLKRLPWIFQFHQGLLITG